METRHIMLQTSCGAFSKEFLEKLPAVEKAMRAKGLDPAGFVIAKDRSQVPRLTIAWRPTGTPVDYTIFVKGKSFTVTQPSDTAFLAYFYELCMAADDTGVRPSGARHATAKSPSIFSRIVNWLNKPAIKP